MAKSVVIQESSKLPDFGNPIIQLEKPAFIGNTHNRRPPRMSESMQMDINPPPIMQQKSNSNQENSNNISPGMQKRFKDPK